MAATPLRNFRIPDEVYDPAASRAAERGETLTDVVRRALTEYADGTEQEPTEEQK